MLWWLLACGAPEEPKAPAAPQESAAEFANVAPAKVLEVLPCGDRVAARVQEAQWEFWVAIPAIGLAPTDYLLLGKGAKIPEMDCQGVVVKDALRIDKARRVSAEEVGARLAPPEGGLPIAELVARRLELQGQTARVRGRVVKVNSGIFGKNWLHLDDGTLSEGDLTVTTSTEAKVGDVVVAEAPVTVDKDFGFGYFYAVILEDAKVELAPD